MQGDKTKMSTHQVIRPGVSSALTSAFDTSEPQNPFFCLAWAPFFPAWSTYYLIATIFIIVPNIFLCNSLKTVELAQVLLLHCCALSWRSTGVFESRRRPLGASFVSLTCGACVSHHRLPGCQGTNDELGGCLSQDERLGSHEQKQKQVKVQPRCNLNN